MKFHLLIAGAFACLSFAASAAECDFEFDTIIGEFSAAGAPIKVIPDEELAGIVDQVETIQGKEMGNVTRGFFVVAGGKVLLALEVDGCLIPPIAVAAAQSTNSQLSGKDEAGRVGA